MAVDWYGPQVIEAIRKAAMVGVISGTESVRTLAVKKIMEPPKSGVVYKRHGVSHQASAPGESPANDLGALAASARTEYDMEKLTGYVLFSTAYAAALEYGAMRTINGGLWQLAARPYARPALAELAEAIQAGIRENINKALVSSKRQGSKK